jgi:hypothetical protein
VKLERLTLAKKCGGQIGNVRMRFVKDYFRKDSADPRQYDLVVNSSRFSVGECADLIVESLRRFQAHEPVATQVSSVRAI